MFQPFTFARPQQLAPGGYPVAPGGYSGGYPVAPSGFAQVASMTSPWVTPAGQIAPAGQVADPLAFYRTMSPTMQLLIVLSAGFSGYHGYKRNHDSVGWAFGWAALGVLAPVIVPIVAVIEGYAKPAGSSK